MNKEFILIITIRGKNRLTFYVPLNRCSTCCRNVILSAQKLLMQCFLMNRFCVCVYISIIFSFSIHSDFKDTHYTGHFMWMDAHKNESNPIPSIDGYCVQWIFSQEIKLIGKTKDSKYCTSHIQIYFFLYWIDLNLFSLFELEKDYVQIKAKANRFLGNIQLRIFMHA